MQNSKMKYFMQILFLQLLYPLWFKNYNENIGAFKGHPFNCLKKN